MFDAELEDFKAKIDLRAYAASQGYQLDKRDTDNHYVFSRCIVRPRGRLSISSRCNKVSASGRCAKSSGLGLERRPSLFLFSRLSSKPQKTA